jgi:hypothetical protein
MPHLTLTAPPLLIPSLSDDGHASHPNDGPSRGDDPSLAAAATADRAHTAGPLAATTQ